MSSDVGIRVSRERAAARDLASVLSESRGAILTALAKLAEVAELDFADLFAAIGKGKTAGVATIQRRASAEDVVAATRAAVVPGIIGPPMYVETATLRRAWEQGMKRYCSDEKRLPSGAAIWRPAVT